MKPLSARADWFAVEADRAGLPELQAFYDANPEYWLIVYGHPPRPDDAVSDFFARPPEEMPYSEVCSPDGRFRVSVQGTAGLAPTILESSSNLFDWKPVFTNPPAVGSFDFYDSQVANGAPPRFYRAFEGPTQ